MGLMQKTRPIDRLRYQARLIFDHFDADEDGLLSSVELSSFSFFAKKQLGEVGAMQESWTSVDYLDYEAFVELIRLQIAAVKGKKDWVAGQIPPKDLNRLLFKSSITMQEMAVVLATFKLLDWAGTGSIKLEDLRKAQGMTRSQPTLALALTLTLTRTLTLAFPNFLSHRFRKGCCGGQA